MNYICTDCMDPCLTVEETFDYAGSHCTNGQAGTHHTGHFVSACCLAEVIDESEVDFLAEHIELVHIGDKPKPVCKICESTDVEMKGMCHECLVVTYA